MFTLPDLPFAYDSLKPHIDPETMEIHHSKHHAAYVKNLNDILSTLPNLSSKTESDLSQLLRDMSVIPEEQRTKFRNNAGGHFNHSLFWKTMSPNPKPVSGSLLEAIKSVFGSEDSFQEKFSAAALSRFGSGWAWLVSDSGRLDIMDTPNQDNPLMTGKQPILGVDVWEHAYYLKYQNRRADYLKAWFEVIDWEEVGKNYV